MKICIIYDTFYGNTQKVAELYKGNLAEFHPSLLKVDVVTQEVIDAYDIILFGAPTRAFNMTKKMKKVLKKYKYQNKYFMAFDTRARIEDVNSKLLTKLANRFGYAAEKIESRLIRKEALKLMDYTFYFVKDTEGPLFEEMETRLKKDVTELIKKIRNLS